MSRLADQILAAHRADPKLSWNDLAEQCQCSRARVGQVLRAAGLSTEGSKPRARARLVVVNVEGELDPPEVIDIIARALERRNAGR